MRRISILLSLVSVLAWTGYVWNESDGFSDMQTAGWIIFLLAPLAAYILIMILRSLVLWVTAGFKD